MRGWEGGGVRGFLLGTIVVFFRQQVSFLLVSVENTTSLPLRAPLITPPRGGVSSLFNWLSHRPTIWGVNMEKIIDSFPVGRLYFNSMEDYGWRPARVEGSAGGCSAMRVNPNIAMWKKSCVTSQTVFAKLHFLDMYRMNWREGVHNPCRAIRSNTPWLSAQPPGNQ